MMSNLVYQRALRDLGKRLLDQWEAGTGPLLVMALRAL